MHSPFAADLVLVCPLGSSFWGSLMTLGDISIAPLELKFGRSKLSG